METADSAEETLSTQELMESIRTQIRHRHLTDIEINPLEGARARLEAALESTSAYRPLLAELVDERDWKIRPALRFRSHRPVVGPVLIFIKRRILLPIVYWLYEYSSENFRAQRRINSGLMILLETLAQENARLRIDMERVLGQLEAGSTPSRDPRESTHHSGE